MIMNFLLLSCGTELPVSGSSEDHRPLSPEAESRRVQAAAGWLARPREGTRESCSGLSGAPWKPQETPGLQSTLATTLSTPQLENTQQRVLAFSLQTCSFSGFLFPSKYILRPNSFSFFKFYLKGRATDKGV